MRNSKEISKLTPLLEGKMRPLHGITLKCIQDYPCINLTKLSKMIKRSISAMSYNIQRLVEGGYVTQGNDGFNNYYELTQRGKDYLRSVGENFEIVDRAHDILLTFPIKRMPKKSFPKEEFMVNDSLRGVTEQLTKRQPNGTIIQIHADSSISIIVREVRGTNPKICDFIAYFIAEREIIDLMGKYPGLVVGTEVNGSTYVARISRQSHAIERDAFAVACNQFSLRFKALVFEIDRSHGIPELEFTHPKKAGIYYNRYAAFIEAVAKGELDPLKMAEDMQKLTNDINELKQLLTKIVRTNGDCIP